MKILVLLVALCCAHVSAFKEPRPEVNRFVRTIGQVVNSLFAGENEWQSNVKGECLNRFRCYNGTCVSADLTCDGIADCSEAEDEISSYCSNKRRVDPRNVRSPKASKLSRETWNKIGHHLPMRQAICSDIQFFCSSDSKCISVTNLCDQTNECSQGEDEQNCQFVTCPDNYMKCDTGKCIPNYWICDQIEDCPSAEDETSQDCSMRVCSQNQFRCDTGACLPSHWKCDGQVDCLNGDDEANCNTICPGDSIPCQDGVGCITEIQVCDGVTDCDGGTDEQNCNDLPPSPCGSDFACKDGKMFQCIPQQQLCDGVENCKNGEDEASCPTVQETPSICHGGGRLCRIGSYMHCIPSGKICDGVVNCWDGSDERGCTTPKVTTEPTTPKITTTEPPTTPKITTTEPTPTPITGPPPCEDGLFCKIGSYVYCIPKTKICDGIVNCWDGSDEDDCSTTKITTEPTTPTTPKITTTEPTTTPKITTEPTTTSIIGPPCEDGLFCKIGSYVYCIPKTKICDGIVNCWDGSDEDGCTTTKITTEPTTTPTPPKITTTEPTPAPITAPPPCEDGLFCKIGSYVYCIPKTKICDGIVNCWDGSDEDGCSTTKITTEPTTPTTPKITTEPITTPTTPKITTTEPTPTPITGPPCEDGLFCKIGSYVYCIPKTKICDGIVNCWDGSDEDGCTTTKITTEPTTTPTPPKITTTEPTPAPITAPPPCEDGLFCKIGSYVYCIPKTKICDGIVNCWDGSDEDGCTTTKITTGPTTTPTTPKKITTEPTPAPITAPPPCKDGLFCKIGSYVYCIPKTKICDGIVNCWDGSDEDGCSTTKITTEPTTPTTPKITTEPTTTPTTPKITTTEPTPTPITGPPCEDGLFCKIGSYVYCIPKTKICDGIVNCWDGSDEDGCTTTKITTEPTTTPTPPKITTTEPTPAPITAPPPCKDGLFCKIGSYVYCIPKTKICDGIVNCWDGSDEDGCTTTKITTEPTTTPTPPKITTTEPTPAPITAPPPCKDGLFCKIGSYVYCIPKTKICDGIVNCWDGSDEDGCTTTKITTEPTTTPATPKITTTEPTTTPTTPKITTTESTTTPTTPKITTTESTPTPITAGPCEDGLFCKIGPYAYCIPKSKICDGIVNCWDGADEDGCTTTKITTEPTTTPTTPKITTTEPTPTPITTEPPCKDGLFCKIGPYAYCIPKSKICDGVVNCLDGADEEDCTTTTALPPSTASTSPCGHEIICRSGSWLYCIPSRKKCDGVIDCPDMSDEKHCSTPAPEITTSETPGPPIMTPSCPGYICAATAMCIPDMLLCDGIRNCPFGDDEASCIAPTTASPVACVLGQFECNDGTCIPASKSCDNVMDCSGGEDEDNCQIQTCAVKFRCKSDSFCLSENEWCDGKSDCSDGSDEMDCGNCGAGEFACSSGICIDRIQVCDGRPDCPGPDDEKGCTVIEQCVGLFDCGNGYCVDMSHHCDGVLHCNNGKDEIGCPARRGCVGSDFQCYDGTCISTSMRCNGVVGDCSTGEDEENCDECNQYMCPNKRCLGLSEMCDGVNDCLPGGEDEDPAECEVYSIRGNKNIEHLEEKLTDLGQSLEQLQTKNKNLVVSDETAEKLANQVSILLNSGRQEKSRDEQHDGERNSQEARDQVSEGTKEQGGSKIHDPRETRRVEHLKQILQRHFNEV